MLPIKSSIRHKTHRHRAVWWLGVALTLAVLLCLISPSLASAQNLAEYFQLSYDPVTFEKSEINSEVFHITIAGRVTCTKDLPMSVSEASLTSQVVAAHIISGTEVTLNSSYTITIKPFPSKQNETAEISQSVPLQFPAQTEPGDYNVIGKIVEAKVKVGFIWFPVTELLPQEQQMGVVKYIATKSTAAPTPIPETPLSPQPLPSPLPPVKSIPTGPNIPPQVIIPWWVWLIVAIAAITTVLNIVWFLRHLSR